jgi:hypothetical protein
LCAILSLLAFSPGVSFAHEYPNGFVERSLSIVLRDNVAYGEYSIGLNQATAESFLRKSKVSLADETLEESAFPGEQVTDDAKPVLVPNAVGEHLTDLDTIHRFSSSPEIWFQKHLKIKINSKLVRIEKIQVSPASKHPFSITVKFQFLVATESIANTVKRDKYRLSIVDELFSCHQGAVRQALKAKGSAMLLNSNVAPILVRAKRIELQSAPAPSVPTQTRLSSADRQPATTARDLGYDPFC